MPKVQKKPAKFKFSPFSTQQQKLMHWWRPPLVSSQCDFVVADGAIRSGKTIACIIGFLTWSQEMFAGQSFILAGKTMGALKKNVIRPMLQILEAWGWPYNYVRSGTDARIEIGTNTYYLYGANTEAAQDALQGLTAAGAYLDEAALFPKSDLYQNRQKHCIVIADVIINMVRAVSFLDTGGAIDATVDFDDSIIEDSNSLIDKNVKLVNAGLRSKLTAIMEINKCSEQEAQEELERIRKDNQITGQDIDWTGGDDDELDEEDDSPEEKEGKENQDPDDSKSGKTPVPGDKE